MSNLEIKAAELAISPKKGSGKAFLDTFIFEPENISEQNLGSLYIIGEITDISSNSEYLINLLVATIKKEYYSNTNRSPMKSIEASLNKTNEMLSDFAEQGNIGWIGNLHITVAVFKDDILYFSQAGKSKAILVRGKNVTDIGQDLVSDPKPHPLKTFSNIANGQIEPGDKLILTTSNFELRNWKERIKNIIEDDPDDFAEKLELILKNSGEIGLMYLEANQKAASNFSFKNISAELSEKIGEDISADNAREFSRKYPEKEDRLTDVINQLNEAEKKIPASQKIKALAKTVKFITSGTGRVIRTFYALSRQLFAALYAFIKPKMILAGNMIYSRAKIFASNLKAKTSASPVLANAANQWENSKNNITQKMPFFSPGIIPAIPKKYIAVTAAVIILAIILSSKVIVMTKQSENKKNLEYYSALLQSAEKDIKEAELANMYENSDKTRDLIRTSMASAEKIMESGYLVSEASALKEKIRQEINKLESITEIENPAQIFDFAGNSREIKTDGIIWSAQKIYSYNSENNAIYKYDLAKKTGEIVAVNSKNIGHLKIAKGAKSKIIFLTDSPGIALYDTQKNELKNLPIKFREEEKEIVDLAIFNSEANLYLLNKNNNEIYKHAITVSGYSKGEKWIKNNGANPLQNPISLAIDGDVYVLQSDSAENIVKMNKGFKKEFPALSLLIPLKNPEKILTDTGLKNIYILDKSNKRALVVTKEGKLLKQLASDKFDNLRDIAVDPKEKNLYLLNGTAVFEVNL